MTLLSSEKNILQQLNILAKDLRNPELLQKLAQYNQDTAMSSAHHRVSATGSLPDRAGPSADKNSDSTVSPKR